MRVREQKHSVVLCAVAANYNKNDYKIKKKLI